VPLLAKNRVPIDLHTPVQNCIKNDAWFAEKASDLGWTVTETSSRSLSKRRPGNQAL